MPYGILIFIFNVFFIVHAAKTGRFWPWAYLMFFLPGIGALAYILVELAPAWLHSHQGLRAQATLLKKIDPDRAYRALRDRLDISDTLQNRSALANEAMARGRYEEALRWYRSIAADPLGHEPNFFLGQAQAQFALQQPEAALATLDELKSHWPDYQSPEGHLLYARSLEGAGRNSEAMDEYKALGRYYPGPEPRVRLAHLLAQQGQFAAARAEAEEVLRPLRLSPGHVRKRQVEWLQAARKLAKG